MFGWGKNEDYIFMARTFWIEMNVPMSLVKWKYREAFGEVERTIETRSEAISFLSQITGQFQEKMVTRLKDENVNAVIKDLYKILDECFHFYMRQKEARYKLVEMKVNDSAIGDVFKENRNMARNVIDSVNLWIENCLLYQESIELHYDLKSFDVNQELFVDLYIYGLALRALSLLSMSKKLGKKALFYGLQITPDNNEPAEVLRDHPVIYFITLLTGNQNVFTMDLEEYRKAGESEFGIGFKKDYGIDFLLSLRTMSTIQQKMLKGGKYAYTVIDKGQFINWINENTGGLVDGAVFFEAFALTKKRIASQLKGHDPFIWVMSANKYRHEIRPFVCLDNNRIAISYTAIDQTKYLWLSIFSNGGMSYSNCKDELTAAIEKRNEELSNQLVDLLREKLRSHYEAGFDEIDVQYYRIFGEKEYNYGDYNLVFYAKEEKGIFLIEAKFFSDSFNNSGIISDYEKIFKEKGYYEHCRKRYDLVLSESEKMKKFIGIDNTVKVHFLFVSSKPLEIEFQDKDEVVTFPCLSIFDDYLDGKLLPEVGGEPMRPIHII